MRKSLTSASGGLGLAATLLTPAARASAGRFALANEVYINIGIAGISSLISLAACRPSITGMERSRMIKSGFNLTARSTPTRPFSASPHTSKSSTDSITRVKASLTAAWSSTIKITFHAAAPLLTPSAFMTAPAIG
jgi:hypothetical protein